MIFFLASCEKPVDKSELVGTYTATYYDLTDTLIVSEDGNYSHEYVDIEGGIVKESSRWKFESFADEKLGITFENFVFRKKTGDVKVRGHWHTGIQKHGTVKLCFEYDQGWDKCFSKIPEKHK